MFSFVYGNPLRLINGYDSFGNTCGVRHNARYSNFKLSGLNTIDRPNLFFLDVKELRQTLKICVKECPSRVINDQNELYKYYVERNSSLCRYDFDMTNLLQRHDKMQFFNFLGPCPTFPIYKRCVCVPGAGYQRCRVYFGCGFHIIFFLPRLFVVHQYFIGAFRREKMCPANRLRTCMIW